MGTPRHRGRRRKARLGRGRSHRSRLLILSRLRQAPCSVTELAEAIGMQQSAVSHQLRLLRNLGLVTGTRAGQRIVYGLHDNHVAMLLDEAVYHSEHLRLGLRDPETA